MSGIPTDQIELTGLADESDLTEGLNEADKLPVGPVGDVSAEPKNTRRVLLPLGDSRIVPPVESRNIVLLEDADGLVYPNVIVDLDNVLDPKIGGKATSAETWGRTQNAVS